MRMLQRHAKIPCTTHVVHVTGSDIYRMGLFLIFFQGRFQIDAFSMISIKTRSVLVLPEGLNASKCMRFVCTGPNICFMYTAIWLSACAVMRGPKYLVKISNPLQMSTIWVIASQRRKWSRLLCDWRKLKAYVKYSQNL